MTRKEISETLLGMISPIVEPIGFIKQKSPDGILYRRLTHFGFNDIPLLIWEYDDLFYLSIGFLIRIDDLNKIFVYYGNYVIYEKDETVTIAADIQTLGYEQDRRIKVQTSDDLSAAIKILKEILMDKGLSFFEKFQTVKSIDDELNRNNRPPNLYCDDIMHRTIIGLTAAALNHNPKFSYWEEFYRDRLKNASQSRKDKYEQLTRHLKDKVLTQSN